MRLNAGTVGPGAHRVERKGAVRGCERLVGDGRTVAMVLPVRPPAGPGTPHPAALARRQPCGLLSERSDVDGTGAPTATAIDQSASSFWSTLETEIICRVAD
jgi:hypothetical protein